ncbi:MAG: hypothetical protein U9O78_00285 [Patescibacteria group bacterium]|nr:hypothetical protein [Patescibacteria group bacterium]
MPIDLPINNPKSRPSPEGPSLFDVTNVGRQVLKFSLIFLVSYMVLKMLISAFVSYWKATHPEPPPPPTVGFGLIPKIDFPKEEIKIVPEEYQLETPNGRTPDFGDRAKVFLMPLSKSSLLADETVRKIADRYNFTSKPKALDSSHFRWVKSQPIETTFEINLKNNNFDLTTDYLTRPELLTREALPDDYEAVSRVKSFLSKADLLPDDVATNSGKITYLKALSGETVKAVSLSDSDFVQVDLDRYPIDGMYEMYTPNGEEGVVSAVVTGILEHEESIVEIHYHYQNVDYTQVETYPLMPTTLAWEKLKAGEGYIASSKDKEAVVRDIILAYFDAFEEQSYLQPIYVFKGDDDFIGYVPAIRDEYFKKE